MEGRRPRNLPDLAVTDEIDLDPRDRFLVAWQQPRRLPRPLPEARGENAPGSDRVPREKALFWLRSLTKKRTDDIAHLLTHLTRVNELPLWAILPVAAVRTVRQLVIWLVQTDHPLLLAGFLRHVWPYYDGGQRETVRRVLRAARARPTVPSAASILGAWCGWPENLPRQIEAWPDQHFAAATAEEKARAWLAVFAQPATALVEHHCLRLGLTFSEPWQLRGWLAHTGPAGLSHAGEHLCQLRDRPRARALLEVLCLARAPEAAPVMLACARRAWGGPALAWLRRFIGNAIAGLVPVVARQGMLADEALVWLRQAAADGYDPLIRNRLAELPPEQGERLRHAILGQDIPAHDRRTTPDWLGRCLKPPRGKASWSAWLRLERLPPIILGSRRLNLAQVDAFVRYLRTVPLDASVPLLQALRFYAEEGCLDAFAWAVFDAWDSAGQPPRQGWALDLLAPLGGERCATKLTALIRLWPGEGRYRRAVRGLQVLRHMDHLAGAFALAVLWRCAKNRGVRYHAGRHLAEVAAAQGFSSAELIDTATPHLGMDNGVRVFHLAGQRYEVGIGVDGKPTIRGPDGRLHRSLPTSRRADLARVEWEEFRTRLADVIRVQRIQLEEALVTSRRWTTALFREAIAQHPIVKHLAQALIWEGEDQAGKRVDLFRIDAEGRYRDGRGRRVSLDGVARILLAHPLRLHPREQAAWRDTLVQHEIIPPFLQLDRPVFHLSASEQGASDIRRLDRRRLAGRVLLSVLKRRGWDRVHDSDAMERTHSHCRSFPALNLTAIVVYQPGLPTGRFTDECWQQVTRCYFLPGVPRDRWGDDYGCDRMQTIAPARLDPVVLSEILADLDALALRSESRPQ